MTVHEPGNGGPGFDHDPFAKSGLLVERCPARPFMNKREFSFFVQMLEAAAKAAYELREEEIQEGKALNLEQFKLGKVSQLTLKNQLAKFLKGK